MTGEYKPVAVLHSLLASSLLTLTTAPGTGVIILIYKLYRWGNRGSESLINLTNLELV